MRRSTARPAAAIVAAIVSGVLAAACTATEPDHSTPSPATGSGCPVSGHITYTLTRAGNPSADQAAAYRRIAAAMDAALALYNCYVPATKALSVSYVPSVTTADGNYNGSIRFGDQSTMQQLTAMHEISHALGVGTYSGWSSRLSNGVWTGPAANAQLRAATGDSTAAIHGDSQHFWPYGLNYTTEVTGTGHLVIHCKIVAALRQDLGL